MSSPQPQDDAMTKDADAGLLHRVVLTERVHQPSLRGLSVGSVRLRVGGRRRVRRERASIARDMSRRQ